MKLHVHSANYAAKLSIPDAYFPVLHRIIDIPVLNRIIDCHQDPASGQACNPPDPD